MNPRNEVERLRAVNERLSRQAAIGAWLEACTLSDDGGEVWAPNGYGYIEACRLLDVSLAAGAPVSGDPT
jgi:hypothetical protein